MKTKRDRVFATIKEEGRYGEQELSGGPSFRPESKPVEKIVTQRLADQYSPHGSPHGYGGSFLRERQSDAAPGSVQSASRSDAELVDFQVRCQR